MENNGQTILKEKNVFSHGKTNAFRLHFELRFPGIHHSMDEDLMEEKYHTTLKIWVLISYGVRN